MTKFISLLTMSAIVFGLSATPALAKSNSVSGSSNVNHQVNMMLKSLKVKYVKQYGQTYAYLTGRAVDPDGEAPYQLMFYFMSDKDNHLDGLISDGMTDNLGDFALQYKVPSKGKILVCAHDDQAGNYRCESIKVRQNNQ
jgi:hypothetical protein